MDPAAPELLAEDLAPGDAAARLLDWSELRLVRIRRPEHPLFAPVYRRLWGEFGPRGEMERAEVIAERLCWRPTRAVAEYAFLYEMLAVVRGEDLVAMRDHTAIVSLAPPRAEPAGPVVVHLSHVLVEPGLRGSGLAGWLRAFPVQTARECARAVGGPVRDRVTLVAEMEPPGGASPMVAARRRSYRRAGFLEIDPERAPYCQPDFRAPAEIEASALRPVPLRLLVRRVGREDEAIISGNELRELVEALYGMFGFHVRADHMAPLWALLEQFPGPEESAALRPPLATR